VSTSVFPFYIIAALPYQGHLPAETCHNRSDE